MNALLPTSVATAQPVAGASPPTVFNRWMKVVSDNRSPPVGPSWAPTSRTWSLTQAIAPGLTKGASEEDLIALAQTVLVSRESSHVARMTPGSKGLMLKKCVISCFPLSLNNVASGVNSDQAKVEPDGRHT